MQDFFQEYDDHVRLPDKPGVWSSTVIAAAALSFARASIEGFTMHEVPWSLAHFSQGHGPNHDLHFQGRAEKTRLMTVNPSISLLMFYRPPKKTPPHLTDMFSKKKNVEKKPWGWHPRRLLRFSNTAMTRMAKDLSKVAGGGVFEDSEATPLAWLHPICSWVL